MTILERLKERRDEKKSSKHYQDAYNEAQEIFERQKQGLNAIKDTTGFKEIIIYWERVAKASEAVFDANIRENKISLLARARYVEAKNFLNFVKNILESSK